MENPGAKWFASAAVEHPGAEWIASVAVELPRAEWIFSLAVEHPGAVKQDFSAEMCSWNGLQAS